MFIQLPSALDALFDPASSESRIEPGSPLVLTLAPLPRHSRWAEGSLGVLSAGRCAAAGWMLQVQAPPHTATWTAPAQPPAT